MDKEALATLINLQLVKEGDSFTLIRRSKTSEQWAAKMGDTLARTDTRAIYRFWQEQKDTLPLHYLLAKMVLAGVKMTATGNECLHSVAGFVSRMQRGSQAPETTESLVLGDHFFRERIKSDAALKAVQDAANMAGYVDIDDLMAALQGMDEEEHGEE